MLMTCDHNLVLTPQSNLHKQRIKNLQICETGNIPQMAWYVAW